MQNVPLNFVFYGLARWCRSTSTLWFYCPNLPCKHWLVCK